MISFVVGLCRVLENLQRVIMPAGFCSMPFAWALFESVKSLWCDVTYWLLWTLLLMQNDIVHYVTTGPQITSEMLMPLRAWKLVWKPRFLGFLICCVTLIQITFNYVFSFWFLSFDIASYTAWYIECFSCIVILCLVFVLHWKPKN